MRGIIVFLVYAAFVAVSSQNEVPCMRTREECSGVTSGLMVINNQYFCCGAGFSMQALNNNCTCIQTAEVRSCSTGIPACRDASSVSSFNGNVRCCPSGYSMQASTTFMFGVASNNCACLRWFGNGYGGSVIVGDFNSSEFNRQMMDFGHHMHNWGHQFGNAMADWGRRLGQNMRDMGRRMSHMMRWPFHG